VAVSPAFAADHLVLAGTEADGLLRSDDAGGTWHRPPALVDQALREGYILTPYFAEQLAEYEKQPEAMRLYFPKMVAGINRRRESQRLADVKFAATPEVRVVHGSAAPIPLSAADDTRRARLFRSVALAALLLRRDGATAASDD